MKRKTYKINNSNILSGNISRVRKIIKTLEIAAVLIFIPVITLSSCNQTSIDDMLEEYNEAFDPDFGNQ